MIGLPGRSHRGALPPLTSEQQLLRDRLRAQVVHLAGTIGERNVYRRGSLEQAARYIEAQFAAGGYEPASQEYDAGGMTVRNIESAKAERATDLMVVGAHYDSVAGCPGANDNASGCCVARAFARAPRSRARSACSSKARSRYVRCC